MTKTLTSECRRCKKPISVDVDEELGGLLDKMKLRPNVCGCCCDSIPVKLWPEDEAMVRTATKLDDDRFKQWEERMELLEMAYLTTPHPTMPASYSQRRKAARLRSIVQNARNGRKGINDHQRDKRASTGRISANRGY